METILGLPPTIFLENSSDDPLRPNVQRKLEPPFPLLAARRHLNTGKLVFQRNNAVFPLHPVLVSEDFPLSPGFYFYNRALFLR
jgi:hypothetical protein